ncbi:MAG: response regulator transcription factor [Firmicutes bacterium]|nr:response regulator transcription factor [Bacillota bacterium]
MFKVLLIDDEPAIREGLKTIIDWPRYGCEICGEAVNGRDGLAKIRQLQPDLIIVDIKMPGIDGLELLQELRQEDIKIPAIILTGYSEFAYAQKAANLGVTAYILKPIDEDDLTANLQKACREITERKKTQELVTATVSLATDKIIEDLCWNAPEPEVITKALGITGLHLPWRMYRVCLAACAGQPGGWQEQVRKVLSWFPSEVGYALKSITEVLFVLRDAAAEAPREVLDFISREVQNCVGVTPLITAGQEVLELGQLWLSNRQAQDLMSQKFIKNSGILMINSDEINEVFAGKDQAAGPKNGLIERLCMAIDFNNKEIIHDLLATIRNGLISRNSPPEKIKASYLHLYLTVAAGMNLDGRLKKDPAWSDQTILDELYSCDTLAELHQYILNKLYLLSDYLTQTRPDGVIRKILDYVHRNYHQDLKLETLAQLFNYNQVYLGKLFKNHTGEHFHTYLDRIRLEKAKLLLKEGMKVGEVARKVGYSDIDYLNTKFKKYYGIGPSAYKNSGN